MFLIPDVSQYESSRCFYSIYLTEVDGSIDFIRNDILASVREKYFKTGKKVRNRKIVYQGSDAYKYSYNLSEKFPMKWKKLKNGVLIESTQVERRGVYSVVSYGPDMLSPIKKIDFSANHCLLGNEYYSTSNPDTPYTRIVFSANKRLFLEKISPDNKVDKTLLVLCEYIANEKLRNIVTRYCGSPEVITKTNEGFYYFCSVNKAKNIEDFLSKLDKNYFDFNTVEELPLVEQTPNEIDSYTNNESSSDVQEDIEKTANVKVKSCADKKVLCSTQNVDCPFANNCTPFVFSSSNENVYFFGKTDNGLMNGYGITTSNTGMVLYNGYYTDNKKDGFGTSYYSNGNISHVGAWKNGKKDGIGVHFDPTAKTITIGNWSDDIQSDMGSVFDERGNLIFIGDWSKGERQGAEVSYSHSRGNIFIGKYRDNRKTNEGTLLSLSGKLLYRGEFSDNKKDGFGIEYDENENVLYKGYFKDDLYDGEGVFYIGNNHTIEGVFKNGSIDGVAKEKDETGFVIYEGKWNDGLYHGEGCRYFHGGGRYEGHFEKGLAVGNLKGYNHKGELVYDGEWENDMFNGEGVYFINGEKIYEGEFKNDMFDGKGTEYRNDELVYVGNFHKNKKCGFGTSYKSSLPVYSGEWDNDLYNGLGILYDEGEAIAVGEFLNGKKHGRIDIIKNGTVCEEQVYEDGLLHYTKKYMINDDKGIRIVYASNIKDNDLNGMGCIFDLYGSKKEEGLFVNGQLVKKMKVTIPDLKPIPFSKILKKADRKTYIKSFHFVVEKNMDNKFTYTGELKSGKPYGLATAMYKDHTYTGRFKDGVPNGEGVIYENNGTVFEGIFSKVQFEDSVKLSFADSVTYYLKRYNNG